MRHSAACWRSPGPKLANILLSVASLDLPLTLRLIDLFDSIEQGSPDVRVFAKKDGNPYLQSPSAFATAVDKLKLNEADPSETASCFTASGTP